MPTQYRVMTKKIRKARVKKRRKSFWPAVKDLG